MNRNAVALCASFLVLALAFFAALQTRAEPASTPVANGSFDSGLEHWTVTPGTQDTGRIVASGCEDAHCLELIVPLGETVRAQQSLAPLRPGARYRVEARVHASKRHLIRLGFYDANWRGAYCARKPLAMFVEAQGEDDWQTVNANITVPERDECGPTRDHRWQVEVEFESLRGARPAVLVDDLRVAEISPEARAMAPAQERDLSCAYFRDYQNLDTCPTRDASRAVEAPMFATVAKWALDDGAGALQSEAFAGRNAVIEGSETIWRDGVLHFSGNGAESRARVDAGQGIDGSRFEISMEILPAKEWTDGCLIASQPQGATLGGFRLYLSRATQTLSFELSNGSEHREYVVALPHPLEVGKWTSVRIRGHSGVLEILVGKRSLKQFSVPDLQLYKGLYPLVIGAGVDKVEAGFRGGMRNVTLRSDAVPRSDLRPTPLGFTSRGRWPIDEGAGIVVHDSEAGHHGVFETPPNRIAPVWRGKTLQFGGRPEAGGVMIHNAGPIYGNDFVIDFDAMFDEPLTDSGSLLVSKSGTSVLGGFVVDYWGSASRLTVKLADGVHKHDLVAGLPFKLPKDVWIPFRIRFAHDELSITVAGVEVGRFDLPGFVLARAAQPLLVGAYYYPPSKGVKGSVRNVALYMRDETILEDESLKAQTDKATLAGVEKPCLATALRESMVVGSNLLVPNWLGATCQRKLRGDTRFDYEIELPVEFELVGSGSNVIADGKVVTSKIKRLGKLERDGRTYRRYLAKLSYHSTAGGASGFGPLFIAASTSGPDLDSSTGPRMYFRESGADPATDLGSVALELRAFPKLARANKLHLSLAWMELYNSLEWPKFFDNYGALGFNVVPTLSTYDGVISERTREKFLKRARRQGYQLLVLDSPYHRLIFNNEARTTTTSGVTEAYIDPAYRGVHYDEEIARIVRHTKKYRPEWLMMDIECFEEGAYACLIGSSARCPERLARGTGDSAADPASALTDLGTELIANIRSAIHDSIPKSARARMGLNTSEPGRVYHRLFDFDKLYDDTLDFVQPTLFRESPDRMGARMRAARAAMPRGDIIPWMDPGTIAEFPSEWIYDRVLEVFGSGGMGLAWFSYTNFEGSDFYALARALEAVIPIEHVIVGSEPMDEIKVAAGGVGATGISNGVHHILLLSDYQSSDPTPARRREARLVLPAGVEGTIWDLARKQKLGRIADGVAIIDWRPGIERARTALYYVGPSQFLNGRVSLSDTAGSPP